MKTLSLILLSVAAIGAATFGFARLFAKTPRTLAPGEIPAPLVSKDTAGLALEGYDPIAYFTEGKPSKGDARFRATHEGATYFFVSEEHRAMFVAAPANYAPAYGGYCGYAASIGKVRPANPLLWSIVDGQLIVQHTKGAAELWEKDVAGNKMKADRYWPRLVVAKSGEPDPIDGLLGGSVLGKLD